MQNTIQRKSKMQTIYADNAATTRLSDTALQAMLPYLKKSYGNPSSLYSLGRASRRALDDARRTISGVLNCSPAEITFTSGGSESDNQALMSAAFTADALGRNHIISTAFEHHAVLRTLDMLAAQGFDITLIKPDPNGFISPDDVENAIREDTCLVSVMYANNEIGTIQPIHQIGSICREHGILFHTDAVQAAGHLPIDLSNSPIDLLSISAHKFHGPKGAGALFARHGIRLTSVIRGGAQERGKRAGTENVAAIAGMAAALQEASADMESKAAYTEALRNKLIRGLETIPHSCLNGDREHRLPGNVNMCFEGIEGETLLILLDEQGICASSGSACASGALDPSHVLLALGLPRELAFGALRLTINEDNTESEIDEMIRAVRACVSKLRGSSPMWHDRLNGRREFMLP